MFFVTRKRTISSIERKVKTSYGRKKSSSGERKSNVSRSSSGERQSNDSRSSSGAPRVKQVYHESSQHCCSTAEKGVVRSPHEKDSLVSFCAKPFSLRIAKPKRPIVAQSIFQLVGCRDATVRRSAIAAQQFLHSDEIRLQRIKCAHYILLPFFPYV